MDPRLSIVYSRRSIREMAAWPSTMRIVSVIAVGQPAEQKPPRTQYDATKVHWERYGHRQ